MASPALDGYDADLAPGAMVGDYRIDRPIGVGGMGAVYEATQPLIGKKVAVKVLHRQLCRDRSAVGRFIQEARAVNRIGHPSIVDVFGFGTIDDDRAFLVMELLVGETLAARMRRGALTLPDACEILVEVTHALGVAHDAGVIHRDLKPENVFIVTRRGARAIKLLDFGIAKLSVQHEPPGELTQPGVRVGTPNYLSPEQALGLTVDARTDIYALGVVAFEMLTGRLPFKGVDARELIEKHARLRAPAPSAFCPGLPAAVDDIIAAMLEKDPARRPALPRVREVLAAQQALPDGAEVVRAHEATAPTELIGRTSADPRAHSSRRQRIAAVAAGVTIAGAATVFLLVRPAPDSAPVIAPPADRPAIASPAIAPPTVAPVAAPAPATEAASPPAPAPSISRRLSVSSPAGPRRPKPRVVHPPAPAPAPPRTAPAADDDAVRSPFDESR